MRSFFCLKFASHSRFLAHPSATAILKLIKKTLLGLFANNGRVDIPSTYTLGFAWKAIKTATLLIDYQKINYTDSAAISNPISSLLVDGNCQDALNNSINNGTPPFASGVGCLGGANGAVFGWTGISVVKIGYQLSVGNDAFRV